MNCAARLIPEALVASGPRSTNKVRLGAGNASRRPSRRATAPWPASTVPPATALGATTANVMPSARFTLIATDSALKAAVTSNSGRGSRLAPAARTVGELSTVEDSPEISSTPNAVTPPKSPAVSGRPRASITVIPGAAARPVPTSATRPLRTSTSPPSIVPRGLDVWTVAPRISKSCAADRPGSRLTASRPERAVQRAARLIAHLPSAARAGNRTRARAAAPSGRRRACRRRRLDPRARRH